MTNKIRKHIWPMALMPLAIFGVLAAVVALSAVTPGAAQANSCADIADPVERAKCITEHEQAGLDPDDPGHDHGQNGDGNGGMMGAATHASMPMAYMLQGLDNGARLDWEMPKKTAKGATVIGYRIDRDAWHLTPNHPINMGGDITIDLHEATPTDRSDLGLAYGTTYTYMVQAIVEYDVKHWWNNLGCMKMNDVAMPAAGEPPVGADTPGVAPYCVMYDDLSDAAKPVVHRAYNKLAGKYPDYDSYDRYALGAWTREISTTTADSGGRLEPLLDPPTMVRMLSANPACANRITVSWNAPLDFGSVPELDVNGVYVGPDYIGGNRAGKEEVGEPATRVTYQVQRMVNNGGWAAVTPAGMSYTDTAIAYDNTYEYRVRAMNDAGLAGPWSMVMEELTEPNEPSMPRSLNVDPTAANTVELEWLAPIDDIGLWRTQADFDRPTDASKNLQYQIERQIGTAGNWTSIATPYHQYGEAIADHRTQGYTDTEAPAGNVSYRVAALVNACNVSAYSQKDAVSVVAAPITLGTITNLGLSNSLVLTWTPAANATSQIAIVVNVADDTDFCLAPSLAASASSYTCTGVSGTAGTAYVGLVIALDGSGESTVSNFPVRIVQ